MDGQPLRISQKKDLHTDVIIDVVVSSSPKKKFLPNVPGFRPLYSFIDFLICSNISLAAS
jgi:hypothetical protein